MWHKPGGCVKLHSIDYLQADCGRHAHRDAGLYRFLDQYSAVRVAYGYGFDGGILHFAADSDSHGRWRGAIHSECWCHLDYNLRNDRKQHGPLYRASDGGELHGDGDGDERGSDCVDDRYCDGQHRQGDHFAGERSSTRYRSNAVHGKHGRDVVYELRLDYQRRAFHCSGHKYQLHDQSHVHCQLK
jgi:hypothetical protein